MSLVDDDTVNRACSALLAWYAARKAPAADVLIHPKPEWVSLVFNLKKVPNNPSNKPKAIPLPHPLYDVEDGAQFCLFVKDPSKDIKAKLESSPIPGVTKVIGYTKLRKNYHEYQQKRALCAAYDAFFTDDRILPMLPALLGKTFFEKKRQPVPVRLTKSDVAAEVTKAINSTCFFMPYGSCTSVRVGRGTMSVKDLIANVKVVLTQVINLLPRKRKNVRSIFLKTDSSAPLPLFQFVQPMVLPEGGAGSGKGSDSDDEDVHGASGSDDSDEEEPVVPVAAPAKSAKGKGVPAAVVATASGAKPGKSKGAPAPAAAPAPAPAPASSAATKGGKAGKGKGKEVPVVAPAAAAAPAAPPAAPSKGKKGAAAAKSPAASPAPAPAPATATPGKGKAAGAGKEDKKRKEVEAPVAAAVTPKAVSPKATRSTAAKKQKL